MSNALAKMANKKRMPSFKGNSVSSSTVDTFNTSSPSGADSSAMSALVGGLSSMLNRTANKLRPIT